jgi:hypothetical protein
MPIQHAVTYQAFCKITNFIHDNGDDWHKFCANTAHTMQKAAKARRSNCVMNSAKLASVGIVISPVRVALQNALKNWQQV